MKHINAMNIKLAREYRGLTQRQLAELLKGVTYPKMSKIENGLVEINKEILEKISNTLKFPIGFFSKDIGFNYRDEFLFRKRRIKSKTSSEIISNLQIILSLIDELLVSDINIPKFKYSTFINKFRGISPENSASIIREEFNIQNSKVEDLFYKIEAQGIIVVEMNYSRFDITDELKVDGTSAITRRGIPVIFINKKFPNDRKKFTLAHELGHIILHNYERANKKSIDEMEREANQFAAEFLLPEFHIKHELQHLRISKLTELKIKYGVSVASLIYRAKTLGTIDDNVYRNLMIELSRLGWRKKEPSYLNVNLDCPVLLNDILELYRNDLGFTLRDLSNKVLLNEVDLISILDSISILNEKSKIIKLRN